ncbi:SDR family oxidoreductase [Chiayiivirga flava]|uniref:NAD(P)-dependent dehydrogenase (Short-subunit alcohol dehydrogenase family) n=1 Tax=Chiayiivirga flava TaxID=659595 RepID=A0A7W8G0H2_9GAMM|nr:SDR family oxidoreductase [Chiayiivirga flava]MBB5207743.1 NAD(P)-dependent dehydrogenase (short-subunit alcohol dehydrogenase family) [Chiayiivirga flava]
MQRILITGANRGLGLEFATQLLARGAHVVATCRDPAKANALNHLAAAHPGRLHVLPLDVSQPATIDELVRETALVFDGLDTLINNAGVLVPGERFGSLDVQTMEHTFRVNAVGPVLVTQACADLLRRGTTPKVANVSSQLGSIGHCGSFGTPSYSISKAALNMGMVQLAHALEPDGIPVLLLHPGWARTDMGGPNAQVDPAVAVAGMLREIDALTLKTSGRFRDWQGHDLPW